MIGYNKINIPDILGVHGNVITAVKGVELFDVILLYNQLSQIKNANGVGYKTHHISKELRSIFWCGGWCHDCPNLGKECI